LKIIYYVPCEESELDGSWFKYPEGHPSTYWNMPLMRYCIEAAGYKFKVTDGSEYAGEADSVEKVICFNMPYYRADKVLANIPPHKKVVYLWEPPSVVPELYEENFLANFDRVLTWRDDLIDGKKFFKFFYTMLEKRSAHQVGLAFNDRKLCSLMNRNKNSNHVDELYTERRRVIEFFEARKTDEFELSGHGWEAEGLNCYAGLSHNKIADLGRFKFNFCYENMTNIDGYVSEKIIDCFVAGTVPIYWGASNVNKYVPPQSFIDRRDFSDTRQVYEFISKMNESEYDGYRSAANAFLDSRAVQLFSARNFAEILMRDALGIDMPAQLREELGQNLCDTTARR
jgi:hypothetical protein